MKDSTTRKTLSLKPRASDKSSSVAETRTNVPECSTKNKAPREQASRQTDPIHEKLDLDQTEIERLQAWVQKITTGSNGRMALSLRSGDGKTRT